VLVPLIQIRGGNHDHDPTTIIIEVPHLRSLLAAGTWNGQVVGLKRRPRRRAGAAIGVPRDGDVRVVPIGEDSARSGYAGTVIVATTKHRLR
jgi:hypothetical protein